MHISWDFYTLYIGLKFPLEYIKQQGCAGLKLPHELL